MLKSNLKFILPVLASCSVLGGCAGGSAAVLSASQSSVTYRFKEGGVDKTTQRAEAHCKNYGRRAVLQRVTPDEDNQRIAIYDCVI